MYISHFDALYVTGKCHRPETEGFKEIVVGMTDISLATTSCNQMRTQEIMFSQYFIYFIPGKIDDFQRVNL